MASYLVDLILFAALLITSIRVTRMHRELVRLRTCQTEFVATVDQTATAFDEFSLAVHEFNVNGTQLAGILSLKIAEAHEAIAKLDTRRGPSASKSSEQADGPGMMRPAVVSDRAAAT